MKRVKHLVIAMLAALLLCISAAVSAAATIHFNNDDAIGMAPVSGEILIAENNFSALAKESVNRPVWLNICTQWSSGCVETLPRLRKAFKEGQGKWLLATLDADQDNLLVKKLGINSVPTSIFMIDGMENIARIPRLPGVMTSEKIDKQLELLTTEWRKRYPGKHPIIGAEIPSASFVPDAASTATARPSQSPTTPSVTEPSGVDLSPTPTLSPSVTSKTPSKPAKTTASKVISLSPGTRTMPTPPLASKLPTSVQPSVNQPAKTPTEPGGDVVEGTDANFLSLIARSKTKPVIFQLNGDHCGACKDLMAKFEDRNHRDEGKWTYVPIRADGQPKAMAHFTMWGYPTVIPYAHGVEMPSPGRFTGGGKSPAKVDEYVASIMAAFEKNADSASTSPTPGSVAPPPSVSVPPATGGKLPVLPEGAVQIIDAAKYAKDVLNESKKRPVILDFSKDQCLGCVAMSPVLESKYLADKGKWQYARIDGTQVSEVWQKLEKPWFPTLIAFRDGKEVGRYSGYDNKPEPVIRFIETVMSGKDPNVDPRVIDLNTQQEWSWIKEISQRHPVVLRVQMDKTFKSNAQQADSIRRMADADGGKWTLANLAAKSELAKTIGNEIGRSHVYSLPVTHVIIYQGMARTEDDLKLLHQFAPDEPQLRDWVDRMLDHHYKEI